MFFSFPSYSRCSIGLVEVAKPRPAFRHAHTIPYNENVKDIPLPSDRYEIMKQTLIRFVIFLHIDKKLRTNVSVAFMLYSK